MDIGLDLWGFLPLWAAMPELLQDTLRITWNVILVLIGVNALIIVHEFGHFIVARMCGVRCDKFYIWFDIYGWKIFRFKWGETEYGLGVLPLGGYVKMFGQEDNPGQIAKELEKARLAKEEAGADKEDKEDADAVNYSEEDVKQMESALYAKDSYLSKSVPQRMAIISAGVIMNLIFAFICATGAYLIGFGEPPGVVGSVTPGSPAWKAGLRTGDHIVKADGEKDIVKFDDVRDAILDSSDPEGKVTLTINRPGVSEPIEVLVVPSRLKGALIPTIGIRNTSTTTLSKEPETVLASYAKKQYSEKTFEQLQKNAKRQVVAINGEKVDTYADVVRIQENNFDVPLEYTFQESDVKEPASESVTLAPLALKELGVWFEIGPITAVKQGSEAETLGIAAGDLLVDVDNLGTFDPLQLPQYLRKKAVQGASTVNIAIRKKIGEETLPATKELPERKQSVYGEKQYFDMTLDPIVQSCEIISPQDGVACSPLGISYAMTNRIAGVDAAAGGKEIPIGAVVEKIEFPEYCPKGLYGTSFISIKRSWFFWKVGFTLTGVGERVQIPFIHEAMLQAAPEGTKVVLHTEKGDAYEFTSRLSTERFANDRGLVFEPERFFSKSESLGDAAHKGFLKTLDGTLKVYQFLRNIGGKIDPRAMGGPGTIVSVAYASTTQGMPQFLLFLCIIGANLAVLNILPIPVLDGGHLVFLLYEAIFRKPPNEAIQIGLSYIGLLLILMLMLWAISLDIGIIQRF